MAQVWEITAITRLLKKHGWTDKRLHDYTKEVVSLKANQIPGHPKRRMLLKPMIREYLLAFPLCFVAPAALIYGFTHNQFLWKWVGIVIFGAWVASWPQYYASYHMECDRTFEPTKLAIKQWTTVLWAFVIPMFWVLGIFQWILGNSLYLVAIIMHYVVNSLILIAVPGILIPGVIANVIDEFVDRRR